MPIAAVSARSPSIAGQLRRRRGSPIISISASPVPVEGHNSFFIWFSALVAAVVVIVSVDVCAAAPVIETEGGDKAHVTGSLSAMELTEQIRLTVPVNPFAGVTVIETVLPVVAPGATDNDELAPATTNVGVGVMVTVPFA
jgi:hypothetical protein